MLMPKLTMISKQIVMLIPKLTMISKQTMMTLLLQFSEGEANFPKYHRPLSKLHRIIIKVAVIRTVQNDTRIRHRLR